MAIPDEFIGVLAKSGINSRVEKERLSFGFDDFESAWDVLAAVTTANLDPDVQEQAKKAIQDLMWTDSGQPLQFQNTTQFIIGKAV